LDQTLILENEFKKFNRERDEEKQRLYTRVFELGARLLFYGTLFAVIIVTTLTAYSPLGAPSYAAYMSGLLFWPLGAVAGAKLFPGQWEDSGASHS
jgi:hypothetical protein